MKITIHSNSGGGLWAINEDGTSTVKGDFGGGVFEQSDATAAAFEADLVHARQTNAGSHWYCPYELDVKPEHYAESVKVFFGLMFYDINDIVANIDEQVFRPVFEQLVNAPDWSFHGLRRWLDNNPVPLTFVFTGSAGGRGCYF